ncbi:MAG: tetratricopeptide repeat protein [bacterium]
MKKIFSLLIFAALLTTYSCKSSEPKIVSDEKKADSYYQLGLAAWNQGDYIKAIREFSKAIEAAPNLPHYYNHLGMVYLQDEQYEKSEDNFKKSLKLDNKYSDTRNNLGVLYTRLGRFDEALEEFENAASDALYPFPHYVATNVGIVYRLQKQYEMAEKYFNTAIKMKGTYCEPYKELGVMYDEQGLHEKAAENYKKAISFCPYYVEVLYRGALKLYMLKQEKTGENYLLRCLDVDAKNIKEVIIPYLKECLELAEKVGVTSETQRSRRNKQQIESD